MSRLRNLCGPVLLAALILTACEREEALSTADIQVAAKERVREQLGLAPGAVLFTETFVGRPVDGDIVVCGAVSITRTDGTKLTPRRFIAAADPARWIKFEPVTNSALPSQPRQFAEWYGTCEPRQEGLATGS